MSNQIKSKQKICKSLKSLFLTNDESRADKSNRYQENDNLIHARMRRRTEKQNMKKQKKIVFDFSKLKINLKKWSKRQLQLLI